MNNLELKRQEAMQMGKEEFIKLLMKDFKKYTNKMTTLDILKEHLELYPKYQNVKFLNKVRKLNNSKARKAYIELYLKELKSKKLEQLVKENV